MKMKSAQWIGLLVGAAILAAGAAGAADTPRSLSLAAAIQTAATQNPAILAARHTVATAEANIVQARSGYLPQVDFTQDYRRTDNPMWSFGTRLNQGEIAAQDFDPARLNNPDAIPNFATSFSLGWSLYDGGHTAIGVRQAEDARQAAALGLARTRQQVIARTAQAYVGLLLARRNITVLDTALETARAHLKMVQSRFDSGFVVKSDLLRAQVRMGELQQSLLQAESSAQVAQAALNAMLGIAENDPLKLATPLDKCRTLEGALDGWLQTALATRPDLQQLKLQETIAEAEIRRTKAGHYPHLNLMGNYEINSEALDEFKENYTVGAVMRINLFSGRRISAGTRAARTSLAQLQALRRDMELGIRVQTRRAFLSAVSAWQQIEVAREAVQQAEEGLRIVGNRYQSGLLTIVALMDADVALQQARTRHFKALHDYKVARIQLAAAAGTLDTDFE